jgi:hypothetical protein
MDDRESSSRRPVRFRELLQSLLSCSVDFIIVGGVAAVLEGAPVSTFDLDVVYADNEKNLCRLSEALLQLDAVYVDLAGRRIRPTIDRLRGGGHHLLRTRYGRLDVLGSVGDGQTFEMLLPRARQRTLHGMTLLVLSLGAVIESKEAADRPKDRAVLDLLRQTLRENQDRCD